MHDVNYFAFLNQKFFYLIMDSQIITIKFIYKYKLLTVLKNVANYY